MAKDGTPVQVWSAIHFYNKQVSQFVPSLKQSMSQLSTLNINHEFHEQLLQFVEMTDKIAAMSYETVDLKATGDDEEDPLYYGIDYFADVGILGMYNSNSKCVVMDEELPVPWPDSVEVTTIECC